MNKIIGKVSSGLKHFDITQRVERCISSNLEDGDANCPFAIITGYLGENEGGLCSKHREYDGLEYKQERIKIFNDNKEGINETCPAWRYNFIRSNMPT